MTETFDLLFVVPGVAIGLTIVRLTQFFGSLIVYKQPSEYLRPPAIWSVLWSVGLLLFACEYWYVAIQAKKCAIEFSFAHFLAECVMPVTLSFISYLVCPNRDEPGFEMLGQHFWKHAYLLYLMIALSLLSASVESFAYPTPFPQFNLVRVIAAVIYLFAGLFRLRVRDDSQAKRIDIAIMVFTMAAVFLRVIASFAFSSEACPMTAPHS